MTEPHINGEPQPEFIKADTRTMKEMLFEPLTPNVMMMINGLSQNIDAFLNPLPAGIPPEQLHEHPKDIAFALFMFPTGQAPDGKIVYSSNAPREHMMLALQDYISRAIVRVWKDQETAVAIAKENAAAGQAQEVA